MAANENNNDIHKDWEEYSELMFGKVKEVEALIAGFKTFLEAEEKKRVVAQAEIKTLLDKKDVAVETLSTQLTNFDALVAEKLNNGATALTEVLNGFINQMNSKIEIFNTKITNIGDKAVERIKNERQTHMTFTKVFWWIVSVGLGLFILITGYVQLNRHLDDNKVQQANAEVQSQKQLNADFIEWFNNNPGNTAAFKEWRQKKYNKSSK